MGEKASSKRLVLCRLFLLLDPQGATELSILFFDRLQDITLNGKQNKGAIHPFEICKSIKATQFDRQQLAKPTNVCVAFYTETEKHIHAPLVVNPRNLMR